MAAVFPPPPLQPPQPQQEPYCYNCGARGHWLVACPEPTRPVPAGLRQWQSQHRSSSDASPRSQDHKKGPVVTRYPLPQTQASAPGRYALPPPPPPPAPFSHGQAPPLPLPPPPPPPPPPAGAYDYDQSSYQQNQSYHPSLSASAPPSQSYGHYPPPPPLPYGPPTPSYGQQASFPPPQAYYPPGPPPPPPPPPLSTFPPGPLPLQPYGQVSFPPAGSAFPPHTAFPHGAPPPPPLQGYDNSPESRSFSARGYGPPPPGSFGSWPAPSGWGPLPPLHHFSSPSSAGQSGGGHRGKHQRHQDRQGHRRGNQKREGQYPNERTSSNTGSGRSVRQNDERLVGGDSTLTAQKVDESQKTPERVAAETKPATKPATRKEKGKKKNGSCEWDVESEEDLKAVFPESKTNPADPIGLPLPDNWTDDPTIPPAYDAKCLRSAYFNDVNAKEFSISIRDSSSWRFCKNDPVFRHYPGMIWRQFPDSEHEYASYEPSRPLSPSAVIKMPPRFDVSLAWREHRAKLERLEIVERDSRHRDSSEDDQKHRDVSSRRFDDDDKRNGYFDERHETPTKRRYEAAHEDKFRVSKRAKLSTPQPEPHPVPLGQAWAPQAGETQGSASCSERRLPEEKAPYSSNARHDSGYHSGYSRERSPAPSWKGTEKTGGDNRNRDREACGRQPSRYQSQQRSGRPQQQQNHHHHHHPHRSRSRSPRSSPSRSRSAGGAERCRDRSRGRTPAGSKSRGGGGDRRDWDQDWDRDRDRDWDRDRRDSTTPRDRSRSRSRARSRTRTRSNKPRHGSGGGGDRRRSHSRSRARSESPLTALEAELLGLGGLNEAKEQPVKPVKKKSNTIPRKIGRKPVKISEAFGRRW